MKKLMPVLFLLLGFSTKAQIIDTVKPNTHADTSVKNNVEIEASFPGGESAWNLYIQKRIERNIKKLSRDKASFGMCEVQFIIDKDGRPINVEALTLQNSLLANIFVDGVKNGPKWNPALQNGTAIKAWRRQRVTYTPPAK